MKYNNQVNDILVSTLLERMEKGYTGTKATEFG